MIVFLLEESHRSVAGSASEK